MKEKIHVNRSDELYRIALLIADHMRMALGSLIIRSRAKKAASMQVLNKKDRSMMSERMTEMKSNKLCEFKKTEKENMNIMRLHLELDMTYVNEEEMQILKNYGSVKKLISRDILAPADITLHALNYVILRMFGWQNGHLHNYSLPENVFIKLTDNQFLTWSKLAGVYFRFPTENYEDIYWDDDYREGENIKSWMKKKYTGPYKYKGYGEHYLMNQIEVGDMFKRWDEIAVHEFDFGAEKQPKPYTVKLKEATIDQVMNAFPDVMCYELIERLPISNVLCTKDNGKVDFTKIRKHMTSELKNFKLNDVVGEYNTRRFSSFKQEREYLENHNIPVLPVTDQLIYRYDYGNGWKVLISCEDIYHVDENGIWKRENGKVEENLYDTLEESSAKHRPICIEKDGIELVDDVGGISGFCEMLKMIYEADIYNDEEMEERDRMIEWAERMGWTGRRISLKRTL